MRRTASSTSSPRSACGRRSWSACGRTTRRRRPISPASTGSDGQSPSPRAKSNVVEGAFGGRQALSTARCAKLRSRRLVIEFLVRRLAAALVTLALATVVVFAVVEVLPGDPALVMLGTDARPDTLAVLRAQYGFDQPLLVRYVHWIGGLLSFDLGTSH